MTLAADVTFTVPPWLLVLTVISLLAALFCFGKAWKR